VASPLAEVEHALDQLESEGARKFDAPSCDCVRTLLTRAEELGGSVGTRLTERAADHVARLRTRFEHARQRTRTRLARAAREGGPLPALEGALARGEVVTVRRSLRRLARTPHAALIARAPLAIRGQGATDASRAHRVLAYEDAHAELVAAFALARATDVVPENAGPYNPLRIASELLERMRTVSPLYLTAQLNRLEELASLLTLPELPAPVRPKKPLPQRKRGKREA
jgi:hypothetical protein